MDTDERMPDRLTRRQQEVLDYIAASINERGYPPTLREIGEHFGIKSTNGVNDHLKALEKKGHLRREDLKSRAMRPVNMPLSRKVQTASKHSVAGDTSEDDVCSIPILGRVAAGQPILAVENVEETLALDRSFVGRQGEVFGLRIVGESMIEDGILDGDYVFVRRTPSAKPGDVVVALIDEEATVKRYYPENGQIRFQPANSNMKPIIVKKSDARPVDLLGIVIGVYRRLH